MCFNKRERVYKTEKREIMDVQVQSFGSYDGVDYDEIVIKNE